MHTSELAMPFHYFHTFSLFLLLPNAIEKKIPQKTIKNFKETFADWDIVHFPKATYLFLFNFSTHNGRVKNRHLNN